MKQDAVRVGEVFWSKSGSRLIVTSYRRDGTFRLASDRWGVRLRNRYSLADIESGALRKRRPQNGREAT